MRKKLKEFFSGDLFFIGFFFLLLGLFIGAFYQSSYSIGLRTVIRNISEKIHPSKDSKTLIIERATKDINNIPQNNIFEEQNKKNNKFGMLIKKIFVKNTNQQTIENYR